jgi:hypothetical protein
VPKKTGKRLRKNALHPDMKNTGDLPAPWYEHHDFVRDAEAGFDVASWRHAQLDLWPTLKTSFLLRANNQRILERADGTSQILARTSEMMRRTPLAPFFKRLKTLPFPERLPSTDILFCLAGGSFESGPAGQEHKTAAPWQMAARQSGKRILTLLTDGVRPGNMAKDHGDRSYTVAYPVSNWSRINTPVANKKLFADCDGLPVFLEQVEHRFGSSVLSRNKVFLLTRHIQQVRSFYKRFLETTRPTVIIVQCCYGVAGWGLIAAAHDRGVPVFDLQHGMQGPSHEAYTFPAGRAARANTLPHGYLTWDLRSKQHLDSWVGEPERVIAGAPFRLVLHALRKGTTGRHRAQEAGKKKRPTIVYLAHFNDDYRAVEHFAREQAHWIQLVIRPHPMGKRHNEIRTMQTDSGLVDMLVQADGVISSLSSAVLEAHEMGLPVLVTHAYGRFLLQPVLPSRRVIFGPLDPDNITALLALERTPDRSDAHIRRFKAAWHQFETASRLSDS